MKFRLARQTDDPQIAEIIRRELRKQDVFVPKLPAKKLADLMRLISLIEKEGIPHHLVCKKLPNKLGSGIFLSPDAKPILRNEMIAPYAGEVSIVPEYAPDDTGYAFSPLGSFKLTKDEQAHFDPKQKFHPRRLYSIKLDAEKRGNFTRFINHSSKPNVVACSYSIPKKNRYGLSSMPIEIIYFSKKKILPGEQLLVCYEEEEGSYWEPLGIEPFPMGPKTFSLKALKSKPVFSKNR